MAILSLCSDFYGNAKTRKEIGIQLHSLREQIGNADLYANISML